MLLYNIHIDNIIFHDSLKITVYCQCDEAYMATLW